jgi:hypothetical protein
MSMKRIYASTIGIDQGSELLFSDYETDGEMWVGSGDRTRSVGIKFSESFAAVPNVFVTLEVVDIDHSANQRTEVKADNITPKGFDIVFSTWSDTKVAQARVSWMAIGGVDADDNWEDMY